MKVNPYLGLALSTALAGTALGCAPAIPNSNLPAQAPVPQAQSIMEEGAVHPDQLVQSDRQIMVGSQAMSFEEIRKQLPSRISKEDADRLLVDIDTSKIVQSGDMEVQQRGRGFSRGFGGRGFSRGFGGRGFARGFGRGFRSFGRSRFFGFRGSYFPYYSLGNYYYPYSYAYGAYNYYPYLYGYGSSYYPYSYCY
jgi:hypothetical protein